MEVVTPLTIHQLKNPNTTEDVNINIFNMMAVVSESKKSAKHISCKWKWKFEGIRINLNQKWRKISVDVHVTIVKNIVCTKNVILRILSQALVRLISI